LQTIHATNNNSHIALFKMKNVGDSDIWFTGNGRGEADYSLQARGAI